MSKLIIICTALNRPIELRHMIDSILLQTSKDWILHIIHDGPPPKEITKVMSLYDDERIKFTSTPQINGKWGHPNRKLMLRTVQANSDDYILITNEDNYHMPVFVEYFLKQTKAGGVGFVYCDTVHSYMGYEILKTKPVENLIDMGSFIVRADIAKSVGFNHEHLSADGRYAMECARICRRKLLRILYIPKAIFVHN